MARTKIVCTIGPACSEPEQLRSLVRAGMDVARLNFSHGDHNTHISWIKRLREIAGQEGVCLTILQDLSGPKLRVGEFAEGRVVLQQGAAFTLTDRMVEGSTEIVQVAVENLGELARGADRLKLADGAIELAVEEINGNEVTCRVLVGGYLSNRKGISFPGTSLGLDPLTAKDLADLEIGIAEAVDFIALSFVRSAADIRRLKSILDERGCTAGVIAKLERPEALDDIDAILDEVDGVMVARGDLAIELAPEKVPLVQKRVIREANRRGRYVITATEMLESMVHSQWPTRAEASDVANAVLDGTDAVMLSAETATGDHPARVVEMMERILLETEGGEPAEGKDRRRRMVEQTVAGAIAQSVSDLSGWLDCHSVCCFTVSGTTPRLVSKAHPRARVIGLSPDSAVLRQINLGYSILPVLTRPVEGVDAMLAEVEHVMLNGDHAKPGDTVIIAAGYPFGDSWKTNLVKVHQLGAR